ncbi:hypothetical protein CDD83_6024 [Cordyceps sp. RAO-2017]|nr:hypothetical protein CDD83_6024 [Cordyceps sp. RAO-2017]
MYGHLRIALMALSVLLGLQLCLATPVGPFARTRRIAAVDVTARAQCMVEAERTGSIFEHETPQGKSLLTFSIDWLLVTFADGRLAFATLQYDPAIVRGDRTPLHPKGAAPNANANIWAQKQAGPGAVQKATEKADEYANHPAVPKGKGTKVDTGSFS